MAYIVENNRITIETTRAGIELFRSQEENIKVYSTILKDIIARNRNLTEKIKSISKEPDRSILANFRNLQDKYAFWIFNLLETGEITKQLFLAENDMTKIIYINQYSVSSCKILEKFKNDITFYDMIFTTKEDDVPYQLLNTFYNNHYKSLKIARDKIAAHYDKDKSFMQINDNLFNEYNADETGKNMCELYQAIQVFLRSISQLSLDYFTERLSKLTQY